MPAGNEHLLATNVPSAVQFSANHQFQRYSEQQELDRAFLGYERRPWHQARSRPDTKKEHEAIKMLLTTTYESKENVNRLLETNIRFRDLASLSDEDLEIAGFAKPTVRAEILKTLKGMPNQDPSYEYICDSNTAQSYNNQIIGNAANHLTYLRYSLAATNYKLKILPPEDLVVGDKNYASRFALEALNSVKTISDELAKDMLKLEQLQAKQQRKNASPAKERKLKVLYLTAIAVGTACAWLWWWTKRSHSPNLDNISVKI